MTTLTGVQQASCIVELHTCSCGTTFRPFAISPYQVCLDDGTEASLNTVLYYCKSCGLSIRGIDLNDPLVASHFEVMRYARSEEDENRKEQQLVFISWLHSLVRKHLSKNPETVLDYGCSCGHLLDVFSDHGARTWGVESALEVLEKYQQHVQHTMVSKLDDPSVPDAFFDVITAIDSLSYCDGDNPADVFRLCAQKLKPGGILVTRTMNRNQTHRLYAFMEHLVSGELDHPATIPNSLSGDAIYHYSEKAITNCLRQADLQKVGTYRLEKKNKSKKEGFRDIAALLMYYMSLSKVDLCPGLVVVAQKK